MNCPQCRSGATSSQALPLTTERVRALADIHLEHSLQSTFARRLLWGRRREGTWEVEQDVLGDALVDMLEAIEAGRTPEKIEQLADSLLDEHGIGNPKNAPEIENVEDDISEGEIVYRLLCDKLQRAEAAVLESQIAAPCWDGSLRQAPGWKVSMAEGFLRERTQAGLSPAIPTQSVLKQQSADVVIRRSQEEKRIAPQPVEPSTGDELPASEFSTPLSLKEAVAAFIAERSPKWKSKATHMDQPKRLQTFLDIIGPDMTFAQFSRNRDAIRRYYTVMTSIPAQYSKKAEFKELGWDALIALNVPQGIRFKRETLKNNFNTVRGFLTWAEDEGYLSAAKRFKKVLVDLPEKAEESKKRSFSREELSRLFATENFMTGKTGLDLQRPWKFLTPIMALFTGARIEELSQLELADIRFEPAEDGSGEGVHYILITEVSDEGAKKAGSTKSVKTPAGTRKVPLHPFLMGQEGSPVDLLAYVERLRAKGETRLFPMLKANSRDNYSDAVTKWFTRYRRECGVGGGEGECSDVTFHSFRHTVVTEAKIKDVERRKVKQMVGHESELDDARDITARYEGDYPLSIIARDVIGALDFDRVLGLHDALAGWKEAQKG